MNDIERQQKIDGLRFAFDKKLMELQSLILEIHSLGAHDVIVYREHGTSSEIHRERRD